MKLVRSLGPRWFGSANPHWASLASRVIHTTVAVLSACYLTTQGSTLMETCGNNFRVASVDLPWMLYVWALVGLRSGYVTGLKAAQRNSSCDTVLSWQVLETCIMLLNTTDIPHRDAV